MHRTIILPLKRSINNSGLIKVLRKRRSIREYTSKPLSLDDLSIILWAAQGITSKKEGLRTAPSAGATYPMEIYTHVSKEGVTMGEDGYIDSGLYHYDPLRHTITMVKPGDHREQLYRASLYQECIMSAPVHIVITGIFDRTTSRYGEHEGTKYVYMEAGHVSQNIYLMVTALKLGTVAVGAFEETRVKEILGIPNESRVLYIMPVGRIP